MSLAPTSQPTVKDSQGRPISVGDRAISYAQRHYNQRGWVVHLSPLTVQLNIGNIIEINRVDLEVQP